MNLTTWRRKLLIRDSRRILPRTDSPRMGVCALCGDQVFYRGYELQAHHIYPKSLYPEKQFDLDNGLMICTAHHQGIVHAFNPAMDIRNSSATAGWRQFVPMFRRWVRLKQYR